MQCNRLIRAFGSDRVMAFYHKNQTSYKSSAWYAPKSRSRRYDCKPPELKTKKFNSPFKICFETVFNTNVPSFREYQSTYILAFSVTAKRSDTLNCLQILSTKKDH